MWLSWRRWLLAAGLVLHVCVLSSMALPVSDSISDSSIPPPRKTTTSRDRHKLLLILLDGFRCDYADMKFDISAFKKIQEKGVVAKYLEPVFPSLSFPNYQSLVTGMHPENHGIVMNHMYDEQRNAFFDMLPSNNSIQTFWWNESEPIWISATKAKLRANLYNWPGCEVVYEKDVKPQHCEPYKFEDGLDSFEHNLIDAISTFVEDEADLAQIYVEYADHIGHTEGPESIHMSQAVRKINIMLLELLDLIQDYTMEKKTTTVTKYSKWKLKPKKKKKTTYVEKIKVNVIIVSDHGMTATDNNHVTRISLSTTLNLNDVRFILGQGAVAGVYPLPNRLEKVYNDLKILIGLKVWKKQDIPESFHIRNHTHTPPILVLAEKGYFIEAIKNNDKQVPRSKGEDTGKLKGHHGYDTNTVHDMRGIFYAFGPVFERRMVMPSINTVDIYNMMTYMLDLDPKPNNGSWNKVYKYLRPRSDASSIWCSSIASIVATCACFLSLFVQTKWLP